MLGVSSHLGDSAWGVARYSSPHVAFVFTVVIAAPAETMTIPCQNIGSFNATVNWGDGTSSVVLAHNDAALSHTYASAGEYTVSITGVFPNVYFYGDAVMAAKVTTVYSLGTVGWLSLYSAFRGCVNLTKFYGVGDVSLVNSMYAMFTGCTALSTVDAGTWDTSSLASLGFFLWKASALSYVDVSGWDVSGVTNMASVFRGCSSLPDVAVDMWDISSATTLQLVLDTITLPTARYDAVLIAWSAGTVQPSLTVDFGASKYTLGGAAAAARANLIASDLWTITDGGGV